MRKMHHMWWVKLYVYMYVYQSGIYKRYTLAICFLYNTLNLSIDTLKTVHA